MAAATATLPLFWHLASANRNERLEASVKLVSALQQFQEKHNLETGKEEPNSNEKFEEGEDEGEENEDKDDDEIDSYFAKLDSDNAPDVAYAIRRLIRGLASPRESSRLGFAVALTELLSRIDTVTCEQLLVLLKNASQTSGSMSGQEERDMLFARLFGLKSVVQSGLLFNQKPLRLSSASRSSLRGFETFVAELLELGEKKSWLRESCWWTLLSAVNALANANAPWKDSAYEVLFDRIYVKDKSWSPEKVALTLLLQKTRPNANREAFCGSYFKHPDILSTSNLPLLGRLLKTSVAEAASEDASSKHTSGPWKPQLHFVWDMILDDLLSTDSSASSKSFQDFYRIVVDETLLSSSSSPQRKYWGFLVFQKALHRVPHEHLPMLFTKNFMRTWINQLSKNDRYLHKVARQVASDVQQIVEKDPKAGFPLVLQLTGTNGSYQFDRLTRTKTLETILASTDNAGIREYINYLLKQVNEGEKDDSLASVGSRRSWVIDQLATLIRNGSIPKTDENLRLILDWLLTHAFFNVVKKSSKSTNLALHRLPEPPFSDELRSTCRSKLLSCLSDLMNMNISTALENAAENKPVKIPGVASDGEFWIYKVLKTILELGKDTKHAIVIRRLDEAEIKIQNKALSLIEKIKAQAADQETARGAELLLSALTLRCLCDDNPEADWEDVKECSVQFTKLFALSQGKDKKQESKNGENEGDVERSPIDLVVDVIIGLLEQSTSFTRVIANQSFGMLSSMVTESTVDLILAQLERRDPFEEVMDVDMEDGKATASEESSSHEASDDSQDESSSATSDEEAAKDDVDTEALRKALEAAVAGKEAASDDDKSDESSDEESMNDEQMMAIDEKIAAVFQTRAQERKKGKDSGAQREATYFKNRVLDLVETYMKKQPSNPLVMRFVLPLVELVASSSSDEQQLSDKAKGLLRSRLSKMRDAASIEDASKGVELLEALHVRARKAHSQEIVSTISVCSLFVTKTLIASDEQAVLRIYKESITDFITRKASALNPVFITDFIRCHPLVAWNLRSHVTGILNDAVNGFRQTQAFGILQIMLTSLPQPESKKDEIIAFVPEISQAFLDAMNKSCVAEKPLMNSAHMKQSLKVALSICRFTRRYAGDSAVFEKAWVPEEWEKLASSLSSSENFKASTSLLGACRQISKIVQAYNSKTEETLKMSGQKRKQDTEGHTAEADKLGARKPKRRKVRKARKSSNS